MMWNVNISVMHVAWKILYRIFSRYKGQVTERMGGTKPPDTAIDSDICLSPKNKYLPEFNLKANP